MRQIREFWDQLDPKDRRKWEKPFVRKNPWNGLGEEPGSGWRPDRQNPGIFPLPKPHKPREKRFLKKFPDFLRPRDGIPGEAEDFPLWNSRRSCGCSIPGILQDWTGSTWDGGSSSHDPEIPSQTNPARNSRILFPNFGITSSPGNFSGSEPRFSSTQSRI